jgi:hypothetical protein
VEDMKPLPDSFLQMHNITREQEEEQRKKINSIRHELREKGVNPFTNPQDTEN